MSGTEYVYRLACPDCDAAVRAELVEWDEEPVQFGKCPECGTTSEDDEWVEAEPT